MTFAFRCAVPAFALGLATTLSAQVLIVSPSGGGHSTTIQGAVNAAPSGATILVRAADYRETVTISGKALTILGEPGARLVEPVTGAHLTIANHPAGGRTVIARLRIGSDFSLFSNPTTLGLAVTGGAGEIHVDDVTSVRPWQVSSFTGRLTVTRADVRVGPAFSSPTVAIPGVVLQNVMHATLSDCRIQGGPGVGDYWFPTPGAAGLEASNATLEIVRPRFVGGQGGTYRRFIGYTEGDGGPGMRLTGCTARMHGDAASFVRGFTPTSFRYNVPAGGAGVVLATSALEHGGVAVSGGGCPMPGVAFQVDAGSMLTQPPVPVPTAGRSASWRIAGSTVLDVAGGAGANGALVITTRQVYVPLPFGPLFVDPGSVALAVGFTLDASGRFQHTVRLPFDLGSVGVTFLAQPATITAGGALTLGGPNEGVVVW